MTAVAGIHGHQVGNDALEQFQVQGPPEQHPPEEEPHWIGARGFVGVARLAEWVPGDSSTPASSSEGIYNLDIRRLEVTPVAGHDWDVMN
jgi:hypothetical protein